MELEKTLESPLDCKEVQLVHPKGDQSWVFIGRTDVKAETPLLWPPHTKSWLIVKDPDAGKDWGQEEKGMTEDEMAGWHHRHDGHEFEWTPGVGFGQGGLAGCDSRDRKVSDMPEELTWTELNWTRYDTSGRYWLYWSQTPLQITKFSVISRTHPHPNQQIHRFSALGSLHMIPGFYSLLLKQEKGKKKNNNASCCRIDRESELVSLPLQIRT